MAAFYLWICTLVLLAAAGAAAAGDIEDPSMDPEEANAVFEVLGSVNSEIDWRELFPGDNPCTGGPHGVNCDLDNDTLHVVELNLGWVSDIVNNPPCAANATIHRSILKFRHLRKLFFYQCFFGSPMPIPDFIWELGESLLHLTFQDNSALVGGLPTSVNKLVNLERLVLTGNNLSGPIPGTLGGLKNLRQLSLNSNRFNGSIPLDLGELPGLMILDLSSNSLTGEIPPELGKLQRLEKLDLSGNMLEGELPLEIAGQQQLRFIDVGFNNLSGGIPPSFSIGPPKLESLFLRGNPSLGGSLPGFLGNLRELRMLALSGTGITGSIPDAIGELRQLNSLALDGNSLSGSIPESITRLEKLYHLNLSGNRLSGRLPFSEEFVARLGRNLVLANNAGLCHAEIRGANDAAGYDTSQGFGVINKCSELEEDFGGIDPVSSSSSTLVHSGAGGGRFWLKFFQGVVVLLGLMLLREVE